MLIFSVISRLYILFKDVPDVILFLFFFIKNLFYKSDINYRKNIQEIINILGNGPTAHITYQRNTNEKLMCVNYFGLNECFFTYS